MKKTKKTPALRSGPTPRPILAMATPPSDRPSVTIDRLKGGEINWSLKTPAGTVGAAITRALEEAARLIEGCLALEEQERRYREALRADAAEKLAARKAAEEAEKTEKSEGGK